MRRHKARSKKIPTNFEWKKDNLLKLNKETLEKILRHLDSTVDVKKITCTYEETLAEHTPKSYVVKQKPKEPTAKQKYLRDMGETLKGDADLLGFAQSVSQQEHDQQQIRNQFQLMLDNTDDYYVDDSSDEDEDPRLTDQAKKINTEKQIAAIMTYAAVLRRKRIQQQE